MIAINKAESEIIRKRCPKAHIVRTMRQKSSRHHYYCEESRKVMQILDEIRKAPEEKSNNGKRGGRNGRAKPKT